VAAYLELEIADYGDMMTALAYVIQRKGQVIDDTMVDYLSEVHDRVSMHVENERSGDEVASEIDAVLGFIGGK